MGDKSIKCSSCPECGCEEFTHKNQLGEGYRICAECGEEWYSTINYEKYMSPAFYYEVFTQAGRSLPPKDSKGDACHFDKRSVKRRARKLLKRGFNVNVLVTKPSKPRELIFSSFSNTEIDNLF